MRGPEPSNRSGLMGRCASRAVARLAPFGQVPTHTDTDEPGQDLRLCYGQWMPDAADEKATSTASNRLIKRHFRLV